MKPIIISKRYIVAFLIWIGFMVNFGMRNNVDVVVNKWLNPKPGEVSDKFEKF